MAQLEADLSALSENMLRGVGIKYGKKSIEYSKAGGTIRKRSNRAATPTVLTSEIDQSIALLVTDTQSATTTHETSQPTNGKVKQSALN